MFDSFRQSLNDLMDRATPPEERRAVLARMKATLVQARMGLDDLRGGPRETRMRLEHETRELETMRRRRAAAAGINDAETLALAEKYEAHQEGEKLFHSGLNNSVSPLGVKQKLHEISPPPGIDAHAALPHRPRLS